MKHQGSNCILQKCSILGPDLAPHMSPELYMCLWLVSQGRHLALHKTFIHCSIQQGLLVVSDNTGADRISSDCEDPGVAPWCLWSQSKFRHLVLMLHLCPWSEGGVGMADGQTLDSLRETLAGKCLGTVCTDHNDAIGWVDQQIRRDRWWNIALTTYGTDSILNGWRCVSFFSFCYNGHCSK